jgi:RNA polymerase sigma-70 factor (ECF subfamily)
MSSMTTILDAPRVLSALSDDDIVRRIRGGESALFEILMRRYNQRLYRVARSIVRDEDEAEDVMQQAYVNAFVHLHQFAERAQFSTWLTRIAVYEALARLRRRRRAREVDAMDDGDPWESVAAHEPDPERQAFAGELREALEAALEALPETYRCVFVLRDVEGLNTTEAAECLGVSTDVVKTRLHRAHAFMRRELRSLAGIATRDVFAFHARRCDRVVAGVFARLALGERGFEPMSGALTD